MKCLWSRCKNPVAFRVEQRWNGVTVHVCADHVPGNRGNDPYETAVPNPTEPETRGAYNIFPLPEN